MRKPSFSPLTILVSCTLGLLLLILISVKPAVTTSGVTINPANDIKASIGTAFIWETFSRQFIAPFSAY